MDSESDANDRMQAYRRDASEHKSFGSRYISGQPSFRIEDQRWDAKEVKLLHWVNVQPELSYVYLVLTWTPKWRHPFQELHGFRKYMPRCSIDLTCTSLVIRLAADSYQVFYLSSSVDTECHVWFIQSALTAKLTDMACRTSVADAQDQLDQSDEVDSPKMVGLSASRLIE